MTGGPPACAKSWGLDVGILRLPVALGQLRAHLLEENPAMGRDGSRGEFPVSETAAAEVLSLPMFPELTDTQIEDVASRLGAGAAAGARP